MEKNMSTILEELNTIKDTAEDRNVSVMADAVRWGYGSLRTNQCLESYLRHSDNLPALIAKITTSWDGNDYLSGALWTANRFFDAPYGETPQLF